MKFEEAMSELRKGKKIWCLSFPDEENYEEIKEKSEWEEWKEDDDRRRYREWQSDNRSPY